jgi:16S rRNA processing protein RimM
MAPVGLLSVGRIAKPHGLKGELIVVLTTNRVERVAVGAVLHTSHGRRLVVSASAAHQDRWRVRFADVPDRTAAEGLHRTELFAEPINDPDALWIHELIGATVTLPDGSSVGTVAAVESAGASDLLVLTDGRIIPMVFALSNTGGPNGFMVVIDPPPGLLDPSESW